MHAKTFGLAVLIGLASASCLRNAAFECSTNNECFAGGEEFGVCVEPGYCAFPDGSCESGQRYGKHAGSLGDVCVPPEDADTSAAATGSETGTGDGTTETGSASATDPDTGETAQPDCSLDEDCANGCFVCENQACVPDIGAQGPCSACEACNANGDCDPTIVQGQGCTSGSTIDCKDYVWGEGENGQQWSCYAYADIQITGVCDGLGGCQVPTPDDCPNMVGDPLYTCDQSCVRQGSPCVQGAPVGQVSLGAFCYQNQASPLCKQSCSDGSGSEETHRICDGAGQCKNTGYTDCGAYRCDGDKCGTSCLDNGDCVWFHSCVNNVCVMG